MMSILLVELAKCGLCWKSEMSDDHQSRANLVTLTVQNVMNESSSRLSFQVAHVRSGLYEDLLLAAREDEQSSFVLE